MTRLFATRLVALSTLLAAPTVTASAPVPPAAKEDAKTELARLVGSWEVVSKIHGGQETLNPAGGRLVVTFRKDGSYAWGTSDQAFGTVARIDPTQKPKEIEYRVGSGEGAPTFKAIYKLEGDTFTDCCVLQTGGDRPTEFKSTAENGWAVEVYKRVKND